MDKIGRAVFLGAIMGALLLGASSANASAEQAADVGAIDLSVRPDFAEPVTLASKDGVLEV